MIQRKQTLYLIVAIVAYVLSLFFPVGTIEPKGMQLPITVHCLGTVMGDNSIQFDPICLPLFLWGAVAIIDSAVCIFKYGNLKKQMKYCLSICMFSVIWYLYYLLIYTGVLNLEAGNMSFSIYAILPFVGLVFSILAYKGVKADYELLRSADRIR